MRLRLLSSVTLTGVISCLFSAPASAIICTESPDCLSLGYTLTAADCPKGYIKCPWNTGLVYCECGEDYQYTCDGSNETAGTNQCGNKYTDCGCENNYKWLNGHCVRPKCNFGDIFYTDYTCVAAANHDSSKTVLGIVVYVNSNGIGGQIMAPWPIDANGNKASSNSTTMTWGGYGTDIANLSNRTSNSSASTDYNSSGNTDKIIAAGDANTYPAAWATRKYAPTTDTAGKWSLPAAGIIAKIYNNQDDVDLAGVKTEIQDAIAKVGGVAYPRCCNLTSSEYNNNSAWLGNFNGGTSYGLVGNNKRTPQSVRPVLAF